MESFKGKLVNINGYKLHINEQGKGKGTVVLIAGSLAFSFDWYFVQKEIKKFSKIISYDRPGLAWSDAGPSPGTMKQDVYELHQLLLKSNLKPPFVLVGHTLFINGKIKK
ncbi:MAG: alpha/beta hydrolase [Chitinophagaceae bacterium]|nr:alpha/beta hydrolase [Chitinophagaceae bacterium]